MATIQQVIEKLITLEASVETIRKESGAVYKIIVTGNGCPPLPETVREHAEWIGKHEEAEKEGKQKKLSV